MDKKSLKFHIESQDYFGSLATIIDLIEQTSGNNENNKIILRKIINDLLYLQKNYKIVKNNKNSL